MLCYVMLWSSKPSNKGTGFFGSPKQGMGGGGRGGMGTKNCPLGIMDALPTHITLNFEVVFLQQKLIATQYI